MNRPIHSNNIIPLHRGATARADHLAATPRPREDASTQRPPANFAGITERLNGPAVHVTIAQLSFAERVERFFRLHGELCLGILIGIFAGCLLTSGLAWVIRWTVLS